MLRFAPLLLLLTAAPALGMDMASMEAIINSCQKGQICSCPRAKIARIGKSACGPEPEWILDGNSLAIDPNGNAKKFDKYNKCLQEVLDANLKIDRYNGIFENCQRPHASDEKTKFTNLPARPIYSGDGKTLNEQVQDVKAAEAARQAEEARAYAAAHPPVATQPPAVQPTQAPSPQAEQNQCFRNSRSGMNVQAGYGSPDFFLVCLDPNKTEHWGNDARGVAPNGDGLATAGPNEFKMLMRSCLRAPAEYSCPECCRPTR
jgi:hypothetical protein